MIGKIKRFNKTKGFGFISTEELTQDVFFHYSQLVMSGFKTIEPETEVEFELVEGEKGPFAKDIKEIK